MCTSTAVAPVRHEPGIPTCTVVDVPARNVVLLAEDNEFIAGLVTRILGRIGLVVVRTDSGAQCEERLAERPAEIVLAMLDCRLPDTDGAALGRRLRERSPGLPLLLMSGREHPGAQALAVTGNAVFLRKPFFPGRLEECVAALLGATA